MGGERRAPREGRPGHGQRLGDDHLARAGGACPRRCRSRRASRPARGRPAAPARSAGRGSGSPGPSAVRRVPAERARRQHGHVPAEPRQPLRHRRRALRAGVAGRRVEVGDEEQPGRRAARSRRAPRASPAAPRSPPRRRPPCGRAAPATPSSARPSRARPRRSARGPRRPCRRSGRAPRPRRRSRRPGSGRRSRRRRRRARRGSRSRSPAARRPSPRSGRSRRTPAARSSARRGRRRGGPSGSSAWGTRSRKWTRAPTPAAAASARKPSSSSPPPATTHVEVAVAGPRERLDRDVEALEVVGAVERRDERGDDGVVGDPERARARPVSSGPGRERVGVDAVRHLDHPLGGPLERPLEVGDRAGVVLAEHEDPVGGADQRRGDRALVGLEQDPARSLADQPVLVVDDQRRAAPALAQPPEQRQLGAEDERVVEVDDVEARRAAPARGSAARCRSPSPGSIRWTIAWPGVGRLALGAGGEDLDVVAALGLAAGEAEGGVARAARVGREGRGQVGDPQRLHGWPSGRGSVDRADEALDARLLDRPLAARRASPTSGSQPRISRARVMSGWRTCGSSTGSASKTISERDSVTSMTASASSSSVYSSGLPMLTGRWASDSISATSPRTRSST